MAALHRQRMSQGPRQLPTEGRGVTEAALEWDEKWGGHGSIV